MKPERLNIRLEHKVQTVVLNHPPANTLDSRAMEELAQTFAAAERDPQVKVVVLTGAGKFFAAGADIKAFADIGDEETARRFAEKGQALMDRIENMSKPVIAQINGYCLGGGLELAMACHIRIASETAQLGQPEIQLGIIPGYGGTWRLPRLTNGGKAAELMLTGGRIDGREAERIGLVSRAEPPERLGDAVRELAARIAAHSLPALSAVLEVLRRGRGADRAAGLRIEAEAFGRRFESDDAKEGVQAFLQKRPPDFKDR